MTSKLTLLSVATVAIGLVPTVAFAQTDLMSLDGDNLRGELQTRYDAGLAKTVDQAVVNANDPRYLWASEAKVQCAIAIGFMKSSTKDETSIRKCALASDMMNRAPNPPQMVVPPVSQGVCSREAPGIIFFDFDSAVPGTEAGQVVAFVAQNAGSCQWKSLQVVGHTDRAGASAYNNHLSLERAEAVANMLASSGISRAIMAVEARGEEQPRVPTEDGVRNPQNRRVEILVSE